MKQSINEPILEGIERKFYKGIHGEIYGAISKGIIKEKQWNPWKNSWKKILRKYLLISGMIILKNRWTIFKEPLENFLVQSLKCYKYYVMQGRERGGLVLSFSRTFPKDFSQNSTDFFKKNLLHVFFSTNSDEIPPGISPVSLGAFLWNFFRTSPNFFLLKI